MTACFFTDSISAPRSSRARLPRRRSLSSSHRPFRLSQTSTVMLLRSSRALRRAAPIELTSEEGLFSSITRKSMRLASRPLDCCWVWRNSSSMPKIAATPAASSPRDCRAMRCVASISRAVDLARCR